MKSAGLSRRTGFFVNHFKSPYFENQISLSVRFHELHRIFTVGSVFLLFSKEKWLNRLRIGWNSLHSAITRTLHTPETGLKCRPFSSVIAGRSTLFSRRNVFDCPCGCWSGLRRWGGETCGFLSAQRAIICGPLQSFDRLTLIGFYLPAALIGWYGQCVGLLDCCALEGRPMIKESSSKTIKSAVDRQWGLEWGWLKNKHSHCPVLKWNFQASDVSCWCLPGLCPGP